MALLTQYFSKVKPLRKLWNINNIKNLSVILSTSVVTDTGKYMRPATGLGQVKALALVSNSLNVAYKNFEINNIQLSEMTNGEMLKGNVISLGGPNTNKITKILLKKINERIEIVNQVGNDFQWCHGEKLLFSPYVQDKKVLVDYGLIVATSNPLESNNRVFIFSGGHTYGTAAAAQYFTEKVYRDIVHWSKHWNQYFAVIRCDVIDDCHMNVKLVKEYKIMY